MWEVGCPCWLLSKGLSMHGASSGGGSCCLLEHNILDVLTLSSTAKMFTYPSYSLITSKYLCLFSVPSPKLFHVTLEASGCISEEQIKSSCWGQRVYHDCSWQWRGSMVREATYRQKTQRDGVPKKPLVGPTQFGNSYCSSVDGVHQDHVIISFNSSTLGILDLVAPPSSSVKT